MRRVRLETVVPELPVDGAGRDIDLGVKLPEPGVDSAGTSWWLLNVA